MTDYDVLHFGNFCFTVEFSWRSPRATRRVMVITNDAARAEAARDLLADRIERLAHTPRVFVHHPRQRRRRGV